MLEPIILVVTGPFRLLYWAQSVGAVAPRNISDHGSPVTWLFHNMLSEPPAICYCGEMTSTLRIQAIAQYMTVQCAVSAIFQIITEDMTDVERYKLVVCVCMRTCVVVVAAADGVVINIW